MDFLTPRHAIKKHNNSRQAACGTLEIEVAGYRGRGQGVEPKNVSIFNIISSLGRYVFGSEISYNKAPPRLPGLGC